MRTGRGKRSGGEDRNRGGWNKLRGKRERELMDVMDG